MNAAFLPSAVSEKPPPIHASRAKCRVTADVAGFSVNRYDHVRWADEKTMPAAVQSIKLGSSSNARVTGFTVGTPGATVAMTLFSKKKYALAIAVTKASWVPSGDHRGFESGPSCATATLTAPVAGWTTEMSAVPLSAGSLVAR